MISKCTKFRKEMSIHGWVITTSRLEQVKGKKGKKNIYIAPLL